MKEDSEFYEAIMLRKEKVGIKKWEKFFSSMYYDTISNSVSGITMAGMEKIFEMFIIVESVKFELIDYNFDDNKHIFEIKSLYTGNKFLSKFKFNYSIT